MIRRTQIAIVFSVVFCVAGCVKLEYLDQLLTLKDLSDEQARLGRYVAAQDAGFEALVKAVQDKTLKEGVGQGWVRRKFGDPVYTEGVTEDGQTLQKWVYRYATQAFDSPKVYLYFNQAGALLRWESINDGST